MTKQILIDASYPEETRVAVVKDGILQSIDRDALSVNQLKGNVYLARVTRVEPSLQAAFVDYGGNRHGFLPFGDISPEYYQVSDQEKLSLMGISPEEVERYSQQNQSHGSDEMASVPVASQEHNTSGKKAVATVANQNNSQNDGAKTTESHGGAKGSNQSNDNGRATGQDVAETKATSANSHTKASGGNGTVQDKTMITQGSPETLPTATDNVTGGGRKGAKQNSSAQNSTTTAKREVTTNGVQTTNEGQASNREHLSNDNQVANGDRAINTVQTTSTSQNQLPNGIDNQAKSGHEGVASVSGAGDISPENGAKHSGKLQEVRDRILEQVLTQVISQEISQQQSTKENITSNSPAKAETPNDVNRNNSSKGHPAKGNKTLAATNGRNNSRSVSTTPNMDELDILDEGYNVIEYDTDGDVQPMSEEPALAGGSYVGNGRHAKNTSRVDGRLPAEDLEDETDEVEHNTPHFTKDYQIQDVIKPNQMIIVQVVKEERGAKGAALTTYLSLAGRYCVFMPNTPGRGGISKKVDNIRDRKILKEIMSSFSISPFSSAIIRTAGIGRKPEEITQDYEYLKKLWDAIQTIADEAKEPCFLHAEDEVIKRCIRDAYDEEVSEVLVESNDDTFREIQRQFRLTLPKESEVLVKNKIVRHEEKRPIFDRYNIEKQFSDLYERKIILPSGGSLVIDITEALVAIDVNSGKTTSERTVEETAVKTNIEAAYEIARQARLRDLAGLIVIDFIDMFEEHNRRLVEKAMRDATYNDRAKIQVLRLSNLGLMEMSRQRLGGSFFEISSKCCPCCGGCGIVLSAEIVAISVLRALRNACCDNKVQAVHATVNSATLAYLLNYKRENISQMEQMFDVHIFLQANDNIGEKGFEIRRVKSLTDEEQRDLRLKVVTAKVNSEDIKSEYLYEEYLRASANGTDDDTKVENGIAMNNRVAEDNTRSTRDKNATNNRNKGDNTNRNLQTSGGLVSSIVSLFKKAFSGGEAATTKNKPTTPANKNNGGYNRQYNNKRSRRYRRFNKK